MFFAPPIADVGPQAERVVGYDLAGALALFLAMAHALREFHARTEVHQAICLANIRLLPDGAVEFAGNAAAPLAYISPEQTGRMNRQIDYRSDYYSLGIVMYELASGHVPFEFDSAMEQIHSHIAKKPLPPGRFNPAIPDALGNIILKLLAKNAEDRYQSLDGLIDDLRRCQRELAESGTMEAFPLAQHDVCDRLQMSQKLYGRDNEYVRLLNAFKRVLDGGAELLLVSGYAGVGKSSLVNELHKPVVAQGGYFISGKFDQFRRTIPYSAINQAFRELMRQILTESENRIAIWRRKLQKALGMNGQLIIDAIPELEFIIGKQPRVPPLGATRNSFNYVMQNFVSVFTHSDHPIVLFLDDLQWADAASLKLISLLMKNLDDPCLLLIGAYRDNEIDVAHPLPLTLDLIRKDTAVTTIEVGGLPEASIADLLADSLRRERCQVLPLAQLVYRKTMGNPFFIGQFVKSLHAAGLLRFEGSAWNWNMAQIEAAGMTDNVVDLLTRELRRLPQETQRLLTIAACIGSRFDVQTLETVSETPQQQIVELLRAATQAGLILPAESMTAYNGAAQSYQFQHDKVQQAAYEGIPKEETDAVHLRIGRLLLQRLGKEEREEQIFDIVDHMNRGRNFLATVEEAEELAELNLFAAKKARQSAAFDVHRDCIQIAEAFGSVDIWSDKQAFMHELYMELINAAFARADYREMERLCQVVCDKSATPHEMIAAKDYLIRCYGAIYKPQELMKTGIEMLEIAGIRLPPDLGEKDIRLARWRLRLALRGRDPLELAQLPPATDPDFLLQTFATMAFLGYGFTYLAGSDVVLWVALEIVRRSIRHGASPNAAYAFAVWGRTLAGKLGEPVEGYKFGKVASLLGEDKRLLGAVGIFHGIIRHRQEHFRLSLEPLLDTYVKAMEIGDRPGAMVALSFSDAIRFQSGGNLRDALFHIRKDLDIYRKMDYPALLGVMIPWAILFAGLVGESVDDIAQGRGQEDYAQARKNAQDPWGVFYVRTIQSIGELYFGDYASARLHAEEALALPGFDYGTPSSGFLMWVHSLAALALCRPRSEAAPAALRKARTMQKRFKPWADHAPMNYGHKWLLIEAECQRVAGKPRSAARLYETAIAQAQAHGFPNDEALSHELAGKFYLAQGSEVNARMHMEQACARYEEWGASAKVRQLEELYPLLLNRLLHAPRRIDSQGRGEAREQQVDMQTLIKASQTLSGEIHLDKLLSKLMLLLIENAGAQKGSLLLVEHDNLYVQAEINADGIVVQQARAVEKSGNLSLAIVNYVKRTREKIVLGDAENDSHFNSDAYIEHHRPKSILCLPLQKQGQLVGILYMENNLAVDAFTSQHAELLQILSTQIAISLENAVLYNELEQKIKARTQALSQKNSELSETLNSLRRTQKQLVESAKLASLGQLVAGVAHEINTPVGVSVTGASTLAEETARLRALYQSGEMKRSDLDAYVGTAGTISKLLLSNMERAATLIQSFKGVAVDQTSEEQRVFRMKPYIEDVLANLGPMLRRAGHRLSVHCDETIEANTYPGALSQIVTNFVTNALMHAFPEDAHGEMLILVRKVYANGRATDLLELRFSDNGVGIPQENLAHIFEPFFTTMRGRGGSGLGLNIIHNLVTGSLRGQITVESQVDVGTTFIVRFPRDPAAAAEQNTHRD